MRISGLEKCSFVDYPGKLAAVIFLGGCNLDCSYCHNQALLREDLSSRNIGEEELFDFLERRKCLLDAVVVTGGEPTLNEELPALVQRIRSCGYQVKLDTNGTNPDMVRKLTDEGLLDYVAMDVKAPLAKYNRVCRALVNTGNVVKTINLLLSGVVPYEFRTTVYPGLTETDLRSLAELLTGAHRWVLQHYSPAGNAHLEIMDPDEDTELPGLERLCTEFNAYTAECSLRGKAPSLPRAEWEGNLDSGPEAILTLDMPSLLS